MTTPTRSPVYGLMFLVASYSAAFVGAEGAFRGLGGWYLVADRPDWAPPLWLFQPLWTVLYGLVAVAGWLAFVGPPSRRVGLSTLYFSMLALGALWPWLFFARRLLLPSLIELLLLLAVAVFLVVAFFRTKLSAALLLLPFVLWLTYATPFNYALWKLNRTNGSGPAVETVRP